MSRPQFFITTSAIVFIFERILPVLVSWPVFIFPVFVILFMLTSKSAASELIYVVTVSMVFDFFSGYAFGFITLAMLAVVLGIFLFKTNFNVNSKSFFLLALYALVFTLAYLAILSIKSEPRLIIDKAYLIITETLVLFLIFYFLPSKLKN